MSIVGIVTGLAFEARILENALRAIPPEQRPFVSCRGMGRAAAQTAAHDLLARGVSAVLSFGIAAGIDAKATPGTAVIAFEVRGLGVATRSCRPSWVEHLARTIPNAVTAPLAHAPGVLATMAEKTRLAAATGAVAADMESYGVAEVAAEAGLPFAALRVVADGLNDILPGVAMRATDALGRVRIIGAVMDALAHPGQIPALIRLGRRTAGAQQQLKVLAGLCVARRFCV